VTPYLLERLPNLERSSVRALEDKTKLRNGWVSSLFGWGEEAEIAREANARPEARSKANWAEAREERQEGGELRRAQGEM
jgi:hypothetical protein